VEESTSLNLVAELTLDQKIGQLVMAQAFGRFRSDSTSEYKALEELVTTYQISGFKLYHGYALGTLMFVGHMEKHAPIPLFFASDLEAGLGQQIVDAPRFPPISALGAIGDPDLAYRAGHAIAQEALRLGINLIFAPLLDLHTREDSYFGLRSIGKEPNLVARIGSQYIKGISSAGALSTAKYFPGNGKQIFCEDGSTTNNQNYVQLTRQEWMPFRAAISAGVDAVMVSHGAFPHLDPTTWDSDAGTRPAALSRQIVTGILRNELGFEGLIITDALNLPFLRKHTLRAIAREAVAAGSDLLIALTTPQDAIDSIRGIYDALERGLVNEAQIDQSVRRILQAKYRAKKNCLCNEPLYASSNAIGDDDTLGIIEEIAQKAVTLLKKPETGFPIVQRPTSITCFVIGTGQMTEQVRADPWQPWHKLSYREGVTISWTHVDPDIQGAVNLSASDADQPLVVVPLQMNQETKRALDYYLAMFNNSGRKVILALPIPPNDARELSPSSWASLWLPDFYQASRQALLRVILGESKAVGFLQ
jgi:beta-N-acetylhexosaminidase